MKKGRSESAIDARKFFEYARRKEARPMLKPLNYVFEPARRPDMLMPERPQANINAAEAALREIKAYASQARELYRERRLNERPMEARDYVRHQLALGMIDTPRSNGRPEAVEEQRPVHAPRRASEPHRYSLFGILRRRRSD